MINVVTLKEGFLKDRSGNVAANIIIASTIANLMAMVNHSPVI